MTIVLLVIAAVAMLALTAFCAGAETAFLSVSRERILHLAREGGRKAKIIQKALSVMPRTMTTLLIGSNLASVAYSSATAALAGVLFSQRATASALWSFGAAFTILYVAEFLPKLALYCPDEIVKELVSQFIVAECSGCPAMLKRGAVRTDPASE